MVKRNVDTELGKRKNVKWGGANDENAVRSQHTKAEGSLSFSSTSVRTRSMHCRISHCKNGNGRFVNEKKSSCMKT